MSVRSWKSYSRPWHVHSPGAPLGDSREFGMPHTGAVHLFRPMTAFEYGYLPGATGMLSRPGHPVSRYRKIGKIPPVVIISSCDQLARDDSKRRRAAPGIPSDRNGNVFSILQTVSISSASGNGFAGRNGRLRINKDLQHRPHGHGAVVDLQRGRSVAWPH